MKLISDILRGLADWLGPRPSLPDYIEVHGAQCVLQPVLLRNARFYVFLLDADGAALTDLCRKWLNPASKADVEYYPLVNKVMVAFAPLEVTCTQKPWSEMGYSVETDGIFYVPVAAVKKVGPVRVVERIAWWIPYIFVDHPWALVTGREVYGAPKGQGHFELPPSAEEAAHFALSTYVLPTFSPSTQSEIKRILEINRTDAGGPRGLRNAWGTARDAFDDIVKGVLGAEDGKITIPGIRVIVEVLTMLAKREVPMLFLKQFRDVADGRKACYRALTQTMCDLVTFRGGGFLHGDYDVTLTSYASHPIAQDLGLQGTQRSKLSFYVDLDFILGDGREV